MSVWQVYYEHWAQDVHKIFQRRQNAKEGIRLTIHHLWCWLEMMPLETEHSYEECKGDLKQGLRGLGLYFEEPDERFKMLRAISETLTPLAVDHNLPDDWQFKTFVVRDNAIERSGDTPWFASPPVERRFIRNIQNRRYEMFLKDLDSNQIRHLDAIVGLF